MLCETRESGRDGEGGRLGSRWTRKMVSLALVYVLAFGLFARFAAGEGLETGKPACLNDCMGRGRCLNGICICEGEYAGEDCSITICTNDCSGHGSCANMT